MYRNLKGTIYTSPVQKIYTYLYTWLTVRYEIWVEHLAEYVLPPGRHQSSELERQLNEHSAALQSPGGAKKALSPQFIEISEFLQFEIHR